MNPNPKHEVIKDFIVKNFYVPDATLLSDDTSLIDQGIVDSTGVLEVTTFLEGKFGITIHDAEIVPENLDTIGRISAFVDRKVS
ncbi:MAG: acyl carrier protein [Byssovorax sp.]